MSDENGAQERKGRKKALHRDDMPVAKIKRIAANRMAVEHIVLDALMEMKSPSLSAGVDSE